MTIKITLSIDSDGSIQTERFTNHEAAKLKHYLLKSFADEMNLSVMRLTQNRKHKTWSFQWWQNAPNKRSFNSLAEIR